MDSPPLVSIVMPAYNAATTLGASMASVLSQTYPHWELLVIDDASEDDTKKIARTVAEDDERVWVMTLTENSGVAAARNVGYSLANGKYVAFLDSDDTWLPTKLEKQVALMEQSGAALSYTATAYTNATGMRSTFVLRAKPQLSYAALRRRNLMSCSSVMARLDVLRPFPEGYLHEDYALWLQMVRQNGPAMGLDEPLLVYRMAPGSKSAGRINSARMTYYAYRQVGYGRAMAFLLCLRYALYSNVKRAVIRRGFRTSQRPQT